MTPSEFARFCPTSSLMVRFKQSFRQYGTVMAVEKIKKIRGVKKFMLASKKSRTPDTSKLFYLTVDPAHDPINILHRILDFTEVDDASVIRLHQSQR